MVSPCRHRVYRVIRNTIHLEFCNQVCMSNATTFCCIMANYQTQLCCVGGC